MSQTKVHQVVGIDGTTVIVLYTEAHCWQFRLISPGGAARGEHKIYYTPEAALKAGLEWVAQGSKKEQVYLSALSKLLDNAKIHK